MAEEAPATIGFVGFGAVASTLAEPVIEFIARRLKERPE